MLRIICSCRFTLTIQAFLRVLRGLGLVCAAKGEKVLLTRLTDVGGNRRWTIQSDWIHPTLGKQGKACLSDSQHEIFHGVSDMPFRIEITEF